MRSEMESGEQSSGKIGKKAVLITGCDTGFGHELAKRLYADGYMVFAGCLQPHGQGAEMLNDFCPGDLHIIPLDVTKEEHIRKASETIKGMLATTALHAVVANAGLMATGEVEWGNDDLIHRIFDVNVFGMVRVVKAFLPLVRKEAGGRIVIVASVAGRVTYPGLVHYSMSKHATISFADGLRMEMKKWKVAVSTIEPVLYKTNMSNRENIVSIVEEAWRTTEPDVKDDYGATYYQCFRNKCVNFLEQRSRDDLQEVVDSMMHAVTSSRPRRHYFCGGLGDKLRFKFLNMLPGKTADRLLCKINQCNRVSRKSASNSEGQKHGQTSSHDQKSETNV